MSSFNGSLMDGDWVSSEDSSNVRAAYYDEDSRDLHVGYGKPGEAVNYYRYPGVAPHLARLFDAAPSKGSWAHRNLVQARWDFERVARVSP